ncbi:cytidylate kinase family protein [Candidatus Marsarchaeota archaeon]|nr:cytidylate kinase family protein [Candidatus Marsarchaeota archaeon]MCL5404876.1 cytidylate kinase family protein [Candidatus Marsarchaeota archaeon]
MKICISGFTASGKTTIAQAVSEGMGISHIHRSYKEFVKTEGDIAAFVSNADPKFTKAFDREIIKSVKAKRDCVVSTWLSPWLVKDATLKIWLAATLEERSKRWARDYGIPIKKAKKTVAAKDSSTVEMAKRTYGIDLRDISAFDIIINTERTSKEEAAKLIIYFARLRLNKGKGA